MLSLALLCFSLCCWNHVIAVSNDANLGDDTAVQLLPVRELSPNELTELTIDYEADHAILFYAQWCANCKQLYPYWEFIANNFHQRGDDIVIGMFDCEMSHEHEAICNALVVDQYPTIAFVGYGDLNQGDKGSIFSASKQKVQQLNHNNENSLLALRASGRVVTFEADLYPDSIYEWVSWMHALSAVQQNMHWAKQRTDEVLNVASKWVRWAVGAERSTPRWTGAISSSLPSSTSPKNKARLKELQSQLLAMEEELTSYEAELSKYKTLEMFDTLKNHGDPYKKMAQLEATISSDDSGAVREEKLLYRRSLGSLPLRMCIADMVSEYCRYDPAGDGKYCSLYASKDCAELFLDDESCRPSSCPFHSSRGCAVVSSCMLPEVMLHYEEAVRDSLEAVGTLLENNDFAAANDGDDDDVGGDSEFSSADIAAAATLSGTMATDSSTVAETNIDAARSEVSNKAISGRTTKPEHGNDDADSLIIDLNPNSSEQRTSRKEQELKQGEDDKSVINENQRSTNASSSEVTAEVAERVAGTTAPDAAIKAAGTLSHGAARGGEDVEVGVGVAGISSAPVEPALESSRAPLSATEAVVRPPPTVHKPGDVATVASVVAELESKPAAGPDLKSSSSSAGTDAKSTVVSVPKDAEVPPKVIVTQPNGDSRRSSPAPDPSAGVAQGTSSPVNRGGGDFSSARNGENMNLPNGRTATTQTGAAHSVTPADDKRTTTSKRPLTVEEEHIIAQQQRHRLAKQQQIDSLKARGYS